MGLRYPPDLRNPDFQRGGLMCRTRWGSLSAALLVTARSPTVTGPRRPGEAAGTERIRQALRVPDLRRDVTVLPVGAVELHTATTLRAELEATVIAFAEDVTEMLRAIVPVTIPLDPDHTFQPIEIAGEIPRKHGTTTSRPCPRRSL
jgi:hypothetical protein